MNTAPKLQHIEVLRQMQADFAASNGLTEEVVALDYAISAMQQAALAPPSGEGVELDHVRQRIELAIEHGDAHGWATARNELAGVLGSSCFTTPQSAPVDGDWRKFYSVEVKSDPPFPYGVAVITDANGEQSVHVHDDNPVLWHLLNKLTTPPPASQERGGDITCYVGDMKTSAGMRYYVCIERNGNTITPHEFGERYKAEYEVACWDAFFNDKPKPSALDFKPPNSAHPSYCPHCGQRDDGVLACCERYMEPPSSAAESDGDPCIECGADPGEPCTPTCCAAEQAKPDEDISKLRIGGHPLRRGVGLSEIGAGRVLAEGWYHFRKGEDGSQDDYDIYDADSNPSRPCPDCVRVQIVTAETGVAEQAQAGELPNVHLLAAQIGVRYAADESCLPDVEFYAFTEAELDKFVATLRNRLAGGVTDKYDELIYAVHSKYPNETRHETALRYIRERENSSGGAAMVAALGAK